MKRNNKTRGALGSIPFPSYLTLDVTTQIHHLIAATINIYIYQNKPSIGEIESCVEAELSRRMGYREHHRGPHQVTVEQTQKKTISYKGGKKIVLFSNPFYLLSNNGINWGKYGTA